MNFSISIFSKNIINRNHWHISFGIQESRIQMFFRNYRIRSREASIWKFKEFCIALRITNYNLLYYFVLSRNSKLI